MKLTETMMMLVLSASLVLGYTIPAAAQATAEQSVDVADTEDERRQQSVERLSKILDSLDSRRKKQAQLQAQIKAATDGASKQALQTELDTVNESIARLNDSFEQIVIGGIDLGVFSTQPRKEFNWQQELVEITKPLFVTLNELTEKPRKIDDLRGQIERHDNQLQVIDKALASIEEFRSQTLPKTVKQTIEEVATVWEQRRSDTQNALELAQFQLASLQGEHATTWETVKTSLYEFFVGRGATLGLALVIAIVIWLLMRLLLNSFQSWVGNKLHVKRITRNRIGLYGYRLLTVLLIVVAVITTFYVRGDVLLLALSVVVVAMLLLGLRRTLPRYVAETKLLLDIGPVRTEERLIWNSIPMRVRSINVYSELYNPELEGTLRLPLESLNEVVSRPARDEPWFPTRSGDYVLLQDGSYGQVTRQSVETVQVKMQGAMVHFPSSEFYGLAFKNLSREGFGLAIDFGIDYQHQDICLDEVPAHFDEALRQTLTASDFGQELISILVEFKEAAASSLDYLILVNFRGGAASDYFKLGRLVQQTCVSVCNTQGWGIPFTQLTIHQGDGFEALRAENTPHPPVPTPENASP